MSAIWNTIILNPVFTLLVLLYKATSNLGWSIIFFTLILKVILIPLSIPSLKMSKKQRDIQPELNVLKEKYKDDKKKQAEMQMELFKKHGINPASGCLTTIITFIILIGIYRAVSMLTMTASTATLNSHIFFPSLQFLQTESINTRFWYLNLAKPDPYFVFTIFAVLLQFLATKMMMPYTEMEEKAAKQTSGKADDIMATMQKQNLYMMPLMFLIFGITLPSGVMLYIIATTLFQIVQTYFYSGWGGLKPWIKKLKFVKRNI